MTECQTGFVYFLEDLLPHPQFVVGLLLAFEFGASVLEPRLNWMRELHIFI
jgi:hypothetical protein